MRSCIFTIYLSFLYETCTYTKTLFTFKKFESGSSIKSRAHYTKNEWPNFDEHIIVMEENEWEDDDVE
jgi:hypothetical protein